MKIIAESAFNHNGSLQYLKDLALAAKNSGAHYFTVQVMHVESFCTKDYSKYELYKNAEFSKEQWYEVFDYCLENDLKVIPCVLEETSLEWCVNYGFLLFKIHATDITNYPLLKKISELKGAKVIIETQCATMFEVKFAINTLGDDKIKALFTGYSNYPSEVEELNLNVLDTFREMYPFELGFADHSLDTSKIPLMLLAKGCNYIEKHITLTRNNRNYDWQVSLYPEEFASMANNLKHYSRALGKKRKHPTQQEKTYRTIMYKKVLPEESTLKRSDTGKYYIDSEIETFDKDNVVVALIARLKSQRLKKKVLKPFLNQELIVDLYNRLSSSNKFKTILATSVLEEDAPLVNLFKNKGLAYFKGDPVSVIDRMLDLAYQEKAYAIYRVTGDNPFADPVIMEHMLDLMKENDLDCVKVNNVPFGVGAELFSTKYLWSLYQKLETTEYSEYLSWYVLNDKDIKIGAIDIVTDKNYYVNLSVDYEEDYKRALTLLNKINKENFSYVRLKDIFDNLDTLDKVDVTKTIKLPGDQRIKLIEYMERYDKKDYFVRKKITV